MGEMRTAVVRAEHDEHVHRADLGDVVLRAVQPEVLRVPELRGVLLREDPWCVVHAEFVCAGACGCGRGVLVG